MGTDNRLNCSTVSSLLPMIHTDKKLELPVRQDLVDCDPIAGKDNRMQESCEGSRSDDPDKGADKAELYPESSQSQARTSRRIQLNSSTVRNCGHKRQALQCDEVVHS